MDTFIRTMAMVFIRDKTEDAGVVIITMAMAAIIIMDIAADGGMAIGVGMVIVIMAGVMKEEIGIEVEEVVAITTMVGDKFLKSSKEDFFCFKEIYFYHTTVESQF
jgi:hypothetical protein